MKIRRGFTLIELLVVVAIIALLIAILIPSLSNARNQAKTVKCASNLHSLYQGVVIYESSWDGYMMPERCGAENISTNFSRWWGILELGPIYGAPGYMDPGDPRINQVGDKIKVMLDCPATVHPPGSSFTADYTYNQRLGDNRFYTTGSGTPYIKKSALRRETIIALDCSEITNSNTDHFASAGDLVPVDPPNSTTPGTHRAGKPHGNGKTANMLFVDGQIYNDNPDKLQDWMIDYRLAPTSGFPFR